MKVRFFVTMGFAFALVFVLSMGSTRFAVDVDDTQRKREERANTPVQDFVKPTSRIQQVQTSPTQLTVVRPSPRAASFVPLSHIEVFRFVERFPNRSIFSDFDYHHPPLSKLLDEVSISTDSPPFARFSKMRYWANVSFPCDVTKSSDADRRVRIYVPWGNATSMSPSNLQCRTPCDFIDDVAFRKSSGSTIDAYVVDTNRALPMEIYNWTVNPMNYVLVAVNIENIEGRRKQLRQGFGIRYLAKPWHTTWWNRFNVTVSYESGADIPLNYFHWAHCRDPGVFLQIERRRRARSWKKEASPVLFMARNCDFVAHKRNGIVRKLSTMLNVDSLGKCMNSRPQEDPNRMWLPRQCSHLPQSERKYAKYCVIASYYFYLSIENSISIDYITEKVYEPLLVGTIPVYLGAPNIEAFLPTTHSAILITDFRSLSSLAKYLRCILRTPSLRKHYEAWSTRPLLPGFQAMIANEAPMCRVCKRVYDIVLGKSQHLKNAPGRPKVFDAIPSDSLGSQTPFKECL